ncbi:MAG: repressor LexA [Planctomycetes bacterium]|nr:repressor LexA [Planctomycetota bacterium]
MSTDQKKSTNTALTKKQADFLDFLKGYSREKGYPPTVREIMRGLGLSSTNIVKKYLDVLVRKGYIKKQHNSPRAIEIVETPREYSETKAIPIVGKVRAGAPHPAIEDITGYLTVDKAICRTDNAFFLQVEGDSMINAHIQEGDLVLVKPQQVANNREIVVALINDEATVKRFYKKGNTLELHPEHPTMKPIVIKGEQDEVRIVGKVTAVVRLLEK